MRPLRLRLAAFCAYGGEQVLDFDALGPHRLFLIHGPTGAGKTSVLDALCYALFGESSGEERGPAHLRSHHAAPDTRTEVELDFTLGAERYRVLRRPAWERPKKRGTGTITEAGEAVLWRLTDDGAAILAEGEREVRPAVESLLGYRAAEFRQVVLLPQGRFRELLTAKPGDRQQILNTLFRTTLYRRIEQSLAERARQAAVECRRLETLRTERLRQAGAETVEDAAVARAALADALGAAEQRHAQAAAAAQHARAVAETGRRQADLLARAEQAAAALAALEACVPEQAARRARLDAARRADRLRGAAAAWDSAHRAAETADMQRAAALAEAEAARAALADAEAALADAPAREQAAAAAAREAARLGELLGRAEAAAAAAHRAQDAATALAEAEAARAEAAAAAAAARAVAEAAQAALAARQAVAAQRERHRLARDAAQARLRDAEALASATQTLRRLEVARARAEAEGTALAARHAEARAAREAAARAIAADHAAHLAASLTPGAPCPVCGATDHPRPAAPRGGGLPDIAALEAAESEARDALAAAREAFLELRAKLGAAADQRAALRDRLGAENATDAAPGALKATAAAARESLAATEAAERALPALRAAAEQAEAAARAAAERFATAERRVADASLARTEAEATRAAHADTLPPGTAAPAALRQAARDHETRARALAEALRAQREARSAAAAHAEAAARRAQGAVHAATAALAARAAQDEEFGARCRAAGFADPTAHAAALLAEAEAESLAAALATFDRDLAEARGNANSAAAAASGLATPDLAALDAAASAAEAALAEAAGAAGTLRERLDAADRLLADIGEAERALDAARRAYEVREDLAEIASGRNRQRLSLEGFVLRSLLDEALAAANRRLRGMLHGRYAVRRVEEPERKNAAIGLDIEVLDEWTGQVRPAATLSGGEGFCAALALALGLADTVQAHAGARRIDALFVDEGFGTLDPEALENAVQILSALQQGGTGRDRRLVGVISHVPELRHWIPARLEVTPGRRGSAAAFRIG